jgi:hypothetical protein
VLIAIIVILAALLFPVFARARESARRAACLSNLKQIALGIEVYNSDYEGFPSSGRYPAPTPEWQTKYYYAFWMALLEPYVRNDRVYRCPSSRRDMPRSGIGTDITIATYGYNEYFAYTDYGFYTGSKVKYPTLTALVADEFNCALFHDWDDFNDRDTSYTYAPDGIRLPSGMMRVKWANGNVGGKLSSRHDGANVIFCDHHARFVPLGQFAAENYSAYDPTRRKEFPLIHPQAIPLEK